MKLADMITSALDTTNPTREITRPADLYSCTCGFYLSVPHHAPSLHKSTRASSSVLPGSKRGVVRCPLCHNALFAPKPETKDGAR